MTDHSVLTLEMQRRSRLAPAVPEPSRRKGLRAQRRKRKLRIACGLPLARMADGVHRQLKTVSRSGAAVHGRPERRQHRQSGREHRNPAHTGAAVGPRRETPADSPPSVAETVKLWNFS
jgi:hypothetical protein